MNTCTFFGQIVSELKLSEEYGTDLLQFKLAVDKYRKNKDGDKIRDRNYLWLEVWDAGARTLHKHANEGDSVLVECTAKTSGGYYNNSVTFRVNEFKIIKKSQVHDEERSSGN